MFLTNLVSRFYHRVDYNVIRDILRYKTITGDVVGVIEECKSVDGLDDKLREYNFTEDEIRGFRDEKYDLILLTLEIPQSSAGDATVTGGKEANPDSENIQIYLTLEEKSLKLKEGDKVSLTRKRFLRKKDKVPVGVPDYETRTDRRATPRVYCTEYHPLAILTYSPTS